MADGPALIIEPARPKRRVLLVVQCWFCGRKWAPSPVPSHDAVRIQEGFCRGGCEVEDAFFGKRRHTDG